MAVVGPWDGSGDPSEDLLVGWVRSFRRWGLWLFVVCGVVILYIQGIGLICAGRVVGVIRVNGCGVGRIIMVGGHADVVQRIRCGAGGSWYVSCAVGGGFLVVR